VRAIYAPATGETLPDPRKTSIAQKKQQLQVDAVAIHQMGKVASASLHRAVADLQLWPCFHTHILHPRSIVGRIARDNPPGRPPRLIGHVRQSCRLHAEYLNHGRPVAVISTVREPVGRNVSAFFQNLKRFVRPDDPRRNDMDALFEVFKKRYPHRRPDLWFERELNRVFNIQVFDHSFSKGGSVVIPAGAHLILMMRASLSDDRKGAICAEFLGVDHLDVPRLNVFRGADQDYLDFKRLVGRDEAYLDRMLAGRVARHFFTEAERNQIRETWIDLGRA
jgi:hypothetical protein